MPFGSAVSAFAHRGARRRGVFLVYAALLASALVLLAAWIVPDARAADFELFDRWLQVGVVKITTPNPGHLWTTLALADVFAVFGLGVIAFLIAPATVAASVANERRAGTLDQLRTTPQPPLALALGFIAGAPARVWLLGLGPLSLHLVAALSGNISLSTFVQSTLVIAVGGATTCALALCVALAPRQESGGAFAALGVAGCMFGLSMMTMVFADDRQLVDWAFIHPAGALNAVMLGDGGLWRRMSLGPLTQRFDDTRYALAAGIVPLLSLVVSFVFGAILLRASCRKLANPDRPLLSKPLAASLFTLLALVVAGPSSTVVAPRGLDAASAFALSDLMLPVLALIGLYATPSLESWTMGRRRGHVGWLSDEAAPHRLMWLLTIGWTLLMALAMRGHESYETFSPTSLARLGLLAATMPVFVLFAATRYPTAPARWGFGVAVAVHLVSQMIAIGLTLRPSAHDGIADTYVTIATLAIVAAPAWVAWRQRVLARNMLVARGASSTMPAWMLSRS
jgi:hypothetical protein